MEKTSTATSMSSPGKGELKAGHPPAVKAGGMRVPSKRSPADISVGAEAAEEVPADIVEEVVSAPLDGGPLIISGVTAKGNKDFPKEAIQAYHEKPQPSHDKRPPASKGASARHTIQQPGGRQ